MASASMGNSGVERVHDQITSLEVLPVCHHHKHCCLRGDLKTSTERCPGVPFPAGEHMYSVLGWQLSTGRDSRRPGLRASCAGLGKQTPAGEGHAAMGTKQRTPLYLIVS